MFCYVQLDQLIFNSRIALLCMWLCFCMFTWNIVLHDLTRCNSDTCTQCQLLEIMTSFYSVESTRFCILIRYSLTWLLFGFQLQFYFPVAYDDNGSSIWLTEYSHNYFILMYLFRCVLSYLPVLIDLNYEHKFVVCWCLSIFDMTFDSDLFVQLASWIVYCLHDVVFALNR